MGLFGDKELVLERTELATCLVALNACGRVPHLAMRQDNRRRNQVGHALALDFDATTALGFRWLGSERVGQGKVLVARGVALKATGTEVLE